eukprot:TRINITY_DN8082_c0_g1_i2.p1 TRINITY_DN8082_c0_g1~~TRINITY_DN8082_c0_g1_i2.p1  ORF type:complete len:1205 (-),score=276.48 TRINITY_DN8082_c0_g1_i2:91-3705(-)
MHYSGRGEGLLVSSLTHDAQLCGAQDLSTTDNPYHLFPRCTLKYHRDLTKPHVMMDSRKITVKSAISKYAKFAGLPCPSQNTFILTYNHERLQPSDLLSSVPNNSVLVVDDIGELKDPGKWWGFAETQHNFYDVDNSAVIVKFVTKPSLTRWQGFGPVDFSTLPTMIADASAPIKTLIEKYLSLAPPFKLLRENVPLDHTSWWHWQTEPSASDGTRKLTKLSGHIQEQPISSLLTTNGDSCHKQQLVLFCLQTREAETRDNTVVILVKVLLSKQGTVCPDAYFVLMLPLNTEVESLRNRMSETMNSAATPVPSNLWLQFAKEAYPFPTALDTLPSNKTLAECGVKDMDVLIAYDHQSFVGAADPDYAQVSIPVFYWAKYTERVRVRVVAIHNHLLFPLSLFTIECNRKMNHSTIQSHLSNAFQAHQLLSQPYLDFVFYRKHGDTFEVTEVLHDRVLATLGEILLNDNESAKVSPASLSATLYISMPPDDIIDHPALAKLLKIGSEAVLLDSHQCLIDIRSSKQEPEDADHYQSAEGIVVEAPLSNNNNNNDVVDDSAAAQLKCYNKMLVNLAHETEQLAQFLGRADHGHQRALEAAVRQSDESVTDAELLADLGLRMGMSDVDEAAVSLDEAIIKDLALHMDEQAYVEMIRELPAKERSTFANALIHYINGSVEPDMLDAIQQRVRELFRLGNQENGIAKEEEEVDDTKYLQQLRKVVVSSTSSSSTGNSRQSLEEHGTVVPYVPLERSDADKKSKKASATTGLIPEQVISIFDHPPPPQQQLLEQPPPQQQQLKQQKQQSQQQQQQQHQQESPVAEEEINERDEQVRRKFENLMQEYPGYRQEVDVEPATHTTTITAHATAAAATTTTATASTPTSLFSTGNSRYGNTNSKELKTIESELDKLREIVSQKDQVINDLYSTVHENEERTKKQFNEFRDTLQQMELKTQLAQQNQSKQSKSLEDSLGREKQRNTELSAQLGKLRQGNKQLRKSETGLKNEVGRLKHQLAQAAAEEAQRQHSARCEREAYGASVESAWSAKTAILENLLKEREAQEKRIVQAMNIQLQNLEHTLKERTRRLAMFTGIDEDNIHGRGGSGGMVSGGYPATATEDLERLPVDQLRAIEKRISEARMKAEVAAMLADEAQRKAEEERLRKECVVCCDKLKDTVFIPCGHHACCRGCGIAIGKCPVCRQPITQRIQVYDT